MLCVHEPRDSLTIQIVCKAEGVQNKADSSVLEEDRGEAAGRGGEKLKTSKGVSLKGKGRGQIREELVSPGCRIVGSPSVWGTPPAAHRLSTGQGWYDPDLRAIPVCAPRHEPL